MDVVWQQLLVHGGPTAAVALTGAVLVVTLLRMEHARQNRLLKDFELNTRAMRSLARSLRRAQRQTDVLIERVGHVEEAVQDMAEDLRRHRHGRTDRGASP